MIRVARMHKRARIRLVLVTYLALVVVVFVVTLNLGWFAAEGREIRGPIPWAWRNRLYPCGFVRLLPVIGPLLRNVPCQVWNLAPLHLIALFAVRWLAVDRWRGGLRT